MNRLIKLCGGLRKKSKEKGSSKPSEPASITKNQARSVVEKFGAIKEENFDLDSTPALSRDARSLSFLPR